MSFSSFSNILDKNFKQKSSLSRQVTAALICDDFDNLLKEYWGDASKNKAKAIYFKNNTLTIACLSSAMAQEIKLNEQKILSVLNDKHHNLIDNIRYLN